MNECALGQETPPITCSLLYTFYFEWAKANGFDVLDSRQFGKEVKKAFPKVERKRVWNQRRSSMVLRGAGPCPMWTIGFLPRRIARF